MTNLKDQGKFLIRKIGNEIQTLCRFSKDKNIFNRFVDGNNISLFLTPDTPFEMWRSGEVFHEGWDDIAPFLTEKYSTVGANHGSPFAYSVTMPRHWYFERDIGKVLTDDAGNRFIIVQIVSVSNFIVHSDIAPGQLPCFNQLQGSLYDEGMKLNTSIIKKVQFGHNRSEQLLPHYRFNKITLTADGETVPENTVIECSSAQLHWDIDLCLTDSMLEYIRKHPGKYISPTAPELESTTHFEYDITFRPDNSYTVDCTGTFLRDIQGMVKFGVIQHYGTIGFASHEKYIPGLKPVKIEYASGETATLDLNTPTLMKGAPKVNYDLFKADCLDPQNPPSCYIDLFGDGTTRQLGVALCYSETRGITAKNSSERGDIVMKLPYSNKIYPYAFYKFGVRAGEKFQISAVRQYFDPQTETIERKFPGE